MELTINLRGDTTLGDLRDVIESCVGEKHTLTSLWVSFIDEEKASLPFSATEKESDALQIKFLRCSDRRDSPVAVGAVASNKQEMQ
jgi:hypothetical protein